MRNKCQDRSADTEVFVDLNPAPRRNGKYEKRRISCKSGNGVEVVESVRVVVPK